MASRLALDGVAEQVIGDESLARDSFRILLYLHKQLKTSVARHEDMPARLRRCAVGSGAEALRGSSGEIAAGRAVEIGDAVRELPGVAIVDQQGGVGKTTTVRQRRGA
jgi:hypothetical protein